MTQQVRIFRPCVSVSQSASGNSRRWAMDFVPQKPFFADPLMGWNGSGDMPRQVKLFFDTQEQALAYAEKMGYQAKVIQPETRAFRPKSYADKFLFRKI